MHICKFFWLFLIHSNTFQAFDHVVAGIKSCSYNFVLNVVPNNNDVMHVANNVMVLNEAPNSNDTTHVRKNAHFNCNGCTTILNGDYIAIMQKSQLTRDKR